MSTTFSIRVLTHAGALSNRGDYELPIEKVNRRPEPLPVAVKCDVHTGMEAYWLIVDHPYAAVTDATGRFTIPGLPVGEQTLTVWHSTSGYILNEWDVTVEVDDTELEPLRVVDNDPEHGIDLVPAE